MRIVLGLTLLFYGLVYAECPGLKNRVRIVLQPTGIKVDDSLTYDQIAEKAKGASVPFHSMVAGVTLTSVSIKPDLKVLNQPYGSKQCVSADIILRFFEPKAIVYLPSNEEKGSCIYQVAYTHEMKHVAVFQRGLRVALQNEGLKIKRDLEAESVGAYENVEAGKQYFVKVVENHVKSLELAINQISLAQAELDSPENYALESERVNICKQRRTND